MTTEFDSFDESPLGAFVESPLGARNAPGKQLLVIARSWEAQDNVANWNLVVDSIITKVAAFRAAGGVIGLGWYNDGPLPIRPSGSQFPLTLPNYVSFSTDGYQSLYFDILAQPHGSPPKFESALVMCHAAYPASGGTGTITTYDRTFAESLRTAQSIPDVVLQDNGGHGGLFSLISHIPSVP